MLTRFLTLCLFAAVSVWGSSATAQQPLVSIKGDTIDTPAGLLAVRREGKPICDFGSCSVVRLGTQVLDHDWTAGLIGAYPSGRQPKFVAYYTHGGGSCCLPSVTLVDVDATPAFSLGGLFLQSDHLDLTIAELGSGLFQLSGDDGERNKLGDSLSTTYLYDQRRRLVWEKPERGVPDYSDLIGAYPHDFLGDAVRRSPLLKVVGEDAYGAFRDHIGVAVPMSLEDRRWLVGRGCVPHACGSYEGLFAIDVRTGKVLAIQRDIEPNASLPTVKIWSDYDSAATARLYGLRNAVDKWLETSGNKLAEGPGPFRVVSRSRHSTSTVPPRAMPSPQPPTAWRNPNRTSNSVGPSFDCTAKNIASQPLAQMICTSDVLSYMELSYVIAYQAVREASSPQDQKRLVDEANALVVALNGDCGLPSTGSFQGAPTEQEVACILAHFQQQRNLLVDRAAGWAHEEAILAPKDTIRIQQALKANLYLPTSATIDGVIGPVTRRAIRAWQQDNGAPATGFASKALLAALNGAAGATSASPQAPRSSTLSSVPPAMQDRTGKTSSIQLVLGESTELRPQEVFTKASEAVYVVETTDAIGSAVAISENELLTNCHVVKGASAVVLLREGSKQVAKVISANPDADRCILAISGNLPSWVKVRPYADVKVGEHAYTIGTPKGLELTLAEGIVSSKRSADGTRYIQTSAPISPGSSGGGLFDAQGNLIGITTFMLKDSQNLNFAIAAEEYAK
jgi:S1-C subfamily serine protease